MSQTFYLICNGTKKKIWIGQGWKKMTTLYTGEERTMKSLKQFLNDHINKDIKFISSNVLDETHEHEEYEEYEGD